MSILDPRIEKLRVEYGLDKNDFWELPQKKGTWLVKHSVLEIVAAKAGISFDMPEILEAKGGEGIAAVCVRGVLGERAVWSIGEANPKNCRNAYPWAMAEKRAVDRVILKLVGIHGLVYSEDEMSHDKDDDAYPGPPRRPSGLPETGWREDGSRTPYSLNQSDVWNAEFMREIAECMSLSMLEKFRLEWSKKAQADRWPTEWKELAVEEIKKQKDHIISQMSPENLAVLPVKDTLKASLRQSTQRPLDDDFPGTNDEQTRQENRRFNGQGRR